MMNMQTSISQKSSISEASTPGGSTSTILGADHPSSSSSLPPTQPIPKKSQQIKTDKPRPHVCTLCTRAFARLEHLKRHERSHTNEKPFQCAACGRCFARRDLVLRHQQKLHASLPNVMRRGSSKDLDINEHIIVLHNNTNANAPLPNNLGLMSSSGGHHQQDSPEFSPGSGGSGSNNDFKPHFRTDLFEMSHSPISNGGGNGSGGGGIGPGGVSISPQPTTTSPVPTTSSQDSPRLSITLHSSSHRNSVSFGPPKTTNTPITATSTTTTTTTAASKNRRPSTISKPGQPSPLGDSPKRRGGSIVTGHNKTSPHSNKSTPTSIDEIPLQKSTSNNNNNSNYHLPSYIMNNYRHASYSAASGSSYTNNKDALDIAEHNVNLADSAPLQVEFATPQLHPHGDGGDEYHKMLDMSGFGLDWHNMDSLDLNDDGGKKVKSVKNLHNFFELHKGEEEDKKGDGEDAESKRSGSIATSHLQQQSQSLPVGSQVAPFEFSVHPPNDINMIQNLLDENSTTSSLPLDWKDAKRSVNYQSQKQDEMMSPPPESIKSDQGPPPSKKKKLGKSSNGHGRAASVAATTSFVNGNHGMPISISNNDTDWLKDLVTTPYHDVTIPIGDNHHHPHHQDSNVNTPGTSGGDFRGFLGSTSLVDDRIPENNSSVSSMFTKRQHELMHQLMGGNHHHHPQTAIAPNMDRSNSNVEYSVNLSSTFFLNETNFITAELRNRMISMSSIGDDKFPSLVDLNHYLQLYEFGFNKYFPFIHLPSLKNPMVDNIENIPLLLSIAAIGALYAYHDSNTLILFNLSKYHIQNFFEKEITLDNLQFKKVPLMAHQCLVLHIFISLFLNEPNMIDITSRQIKSMIGLIKSTNFNEPLEQLLIPPPTIPENMNNKNIDKTQQIIQNNFDYFIMAQSRIRTLHVFYMLQTVRSSLVGLPIYLNSKLLKSGNYCNNEKLWWCETSQSWYVMANKTYANGWTLIDVSNGVSMDTLTGYIHDSPNLGNKDIKLSHNNLLTMLLYVHEKLESEINNMSKPFSYLKWNIEHKPKLARWVNNWEVKYHKNHGTLKISTYNRGLLTARHELKLTLPLYSLVRIKLELHLTSILSPILNKNYEMMNKTLDNLHYQESNYNVLTNSISHCRDVLQLWVYNIETINYDVRETSLRTPVFFCVCLFISSLIISTYLDYIEKNCGHRDISNLELLNWFKCQEILIKVEKVLSPSLKSSYSELLTRHVKDSPMNEYEVKKIMEMSVAREACDDELSQGINVDMNTEKGLELNKKIREDIIKVQLSMKSIQLGIRILADAPVWPVAMGFAEALQKRAVHLIDEHK
ncbi:uncharacterized protein J8A68_001924 [[Candida] subhashii]|uniref:C2H2-type domain-containing protein n=1 Tax=[Candida] subhashii TaxID=561895 RepID=A0A8J5UYS3_9ASCO|nr:uncharacterized protein J8A68_001924 [[Candida] subhashii]KAG7664550.1 hypothetical protein J8A68_001924 [[Candida] subhashii]